MPQIKATVLAKEERAPGIYLLRLFAPRTAAAAQPGQFVHIKCGEHHDYILRRPFSIHKVSGADSIEILFNVAGRGTRWLSQRRLKDDLDILGPLGNGFRFGESPGKIMLVAGGLGIAPLIFLAERLAAEHAKTYALIGAAERGLLIDYMNLKRLTRRIKVTTEDGSQGQKGLVTDILPTALAEDKPDAVMACGPVAMLAEVARLAGEQGVKCQVAMEEMMACGVGACYGCVVKTVNGYKRVCADGPVFDAEEIDWNQ